MNIFNDILGNEIHLDDFVVISSATKAGIKLHVSRVIGFTPKKIKLYLMENRGPFAKQEINVYPISNNFVLVTNPLNIKKLENNWNKIWSNKK